MRQHGFCSSIYCSERFHTVLALCYSPNTFDIGHGADISKHWICTVAQHETISAHPFTARSVLHSVYFNIVILLSSLRFSLLQMHGADISKSLLAYFNNLIDAGIKKVAQVVSTFVEMFPGAVL